MHSFRSLSVCIVAVLLCLPAALSFSQTHEKRSALSFRVTNNHGQESQLTAGLNELATKGLDASLGEEELPPVPPGEIFDVRLVAPASGIALGEGSTIDYRPWPATGQTVTENYRIRFQAGRSWTSVSLRLPSTFTDNIKSLRVDGKSVKAGDSVVTQLAGGDINISIEFNLDPVTFSVSPQSVLFSLGSRDSTLPAPKTIRVTPSSATASWNASVSDSWIEIDRTSGVGTQDISIGIRQLAFDGGRTSGSVLIRQQFGSPPLSIPVHVDMVLSQQALSVKLPFTVGEIYPNPLQSGGGSSQASLVYSLDAATPVSIAVFDALGRKVRTVENSVLRAPGRNVATWDMRGDDGRRLSAGVYRIRVDASGMSRMRSVIVR